MAGNPTLRGLRHTRLTMQAALVELLVLSMVGAAVSVSATAAAAAPVISTASTAGDGWYSDEGALSPSAVGGTNFGQRWRAVVTGQVYAPLVQSGTTVIAATEGNEVDGLNLSDGSRLWRTNLGQPWPTSTIACTDLTPTVGVTSRPVLSPDGTIIYLASKTYTGTDVTHPQYFLHALSVATGAEQPGWPVLISGTADNDPTVSFNAEPQLNRPGLLLMNGVVYLAFGTLCDSKAARGWVAGVSTSTAQMTTLWTTEAHTTVTAPLGGIWEAGGELVSDGPGQILFATGNGTVPPVGTDTSAPTTLASSDVRLTVGTNGVLAETDFFAPYNADVLSTNDTDVGSGAPALLPPAFGTTTVPNVVVQGGKPGYLYVMNAAQLGGRGATSDSVLQEVGPYSRFATQPAVYPGEGGWVYVVTGGPGPLIALQSTPSGGLPQLSKKGQSAVNFGFTSSAAVVTSNGTTPGSALVWAVQSPTTDGVGSNLVAFNAVPSGGVLTQVFSAPIGTAAKFGRPLVASGNVLVGTRDGTVLDFGANPPPPVPLSVSPSSVALGSVPVGGSVGGSFTLTNPNAVALTVSSVAGPAAPFTVGGPVAGTSIPGNSSVLVPVAFAPTAVGSSSSTVTYATSAGSTTVTLTGSGVSAGSSISIGDPAAGGWTFNGSAKVVSGATQLTAALGGQAGDVVYPTAVSSGGISATFTTSIGGGTGADGLTLAFLDASSATPTSLGAAGDGEGFGGLPGVAFALDTYKSGTEVSNNFIGVTSGYASGKLTWATTTATNIPPLRSAGLVWQVSTDTAGHLTVSVNGTTVLTTTVTLPPSVYLAFTGGTGGATDIHTVSNVAITATP